MKQVVYCAINASIALISHTSRIDFGSTTTAGIEINKKLKENLKFCISLSIPFTSFTSLFSAFDSDEFSVLAWNGICYALNFEHACISLSLKMDKTAIARERQPFDVAFSKNYKEHN